MSLGTQGGAWAGSGRSLGGMGEELGGGPNVTNTEPHSQLHPRIPLNVRARYQY